MKTERNRIDQVASAQSRGVQVQPARNQAYGVLHYRHSTPQRTIANSRWRFWPWPGLIVAMLAANAAIVGATIFLAVSDKSFAVEPDYYRKAMSWDQTATQRQLNADLGWIVEIPDAHSGQPIALRLLDRDRHVVRGAEVDIVAFHNATANDLLKATLLEIEPGLYRSDETLARAGSWEIRVVARQGTQIFTAVNPHHVSAFGAVP